MHRERAAVGTCSVPWAASHALRDTPSLPRNIPYQQQLQRWRMKAGPTTLLHLCEARPSQDNPRSPSRSEQEVLSLFSGYSGRMSSPERARDPLGPHGALEAESDAPAKVFVGTAVTCRQKLWRAISLASPLGTLVLRILFP